MIRARFLVASAAAASTLAACAISFDGYELAESSATGTGASASSASGAQGGESPSAGGNGSGASGNPGGAGPSSGGGPTGGAPVGGGGSSGSVGGDGGGLGNCPTQGGLMVKVLSGSAPYCIDQTEVTQADYEDFLASSPDPQDQAGACTGQPFTLATCDDYQPFVHPSWPVNCVDWCDATAFCKAAGKRLCGRISGGSLTPDDGNDANESQWFRACSNDGTTDYPYGDLYGPGDICNGLNALTSGAVNVGMFSACVDDLGVKDLSGNVREWEDACSGGACRVRGGSWIDGPSTSGHTLRCDSDGTFPMTGASGDDKEKIGFRCCADL